MPNLFGLDIAKLVADGIASAGGVLDATLIKVSAGTRTPGSLTGGTNPTETTTTGKGFEDTLSRLRPDTVVAEAKSLVVLLGDTFGGVVPVSGDRVTIDGTTYRILHVERDPAGAVYECQCA